LDHVGNNGPGHVGEVRDSSDALVVDLDPVWRARVLELDRGPGADADEIGLVPIPGYPAARSGRVPGLARRSELDDATQIVVAYRDGAVVAVGRVLRVGLLGRSEDGRRRQQGDRDSSCEPSPLAH